MAVISLEKSHSLTQSLWRSESIKHFEVSAALLTDIRLFELMERAGQAVFEQARLRWPSATCWWIVAGGGNNAGDGYIAARLALAAGIRVCLIQVGNAARLSGDAACARDVYLAEGGVIHSFKGIEEPSLLPRPDLIIDALLGTGLSGPVSPQFAHAIQIINKCAAPVLAIDLPSGLNADTGQILTVAVQASLTVCLVGLKLGLLTGRGPDVVGRLLLADLGLKLGENPQVQFSAQDPLAPPPIASLMHWAEMRTLLPKRRVGAHKGEAGRVLVAGGTLGMSGAIRLAGEAALRCGAGLVRLLSHKDHQTSLNVTRPELMTASFPDFNHWSWASCLVLGPGLGRDPWSEDLFNAALQLACPMVIDADGLWWLAKRRLAMPSSSPRPWVLTPHAGEAAHLLGCTVAEIEADRLAAVRRLQQQYDAVVVLKGAGSLIADECQVRLCHYGHNGMASGGMGDGLSGIIGALLAQGLTPFNAASLAVCLHALAADRAGVQGKIGMLATDLFSPLRHLINQDDENNDTYPTTGAGR